MLGELLEFEISDLRFEIEIMEEEENDSWQSKS
jgi:hypothetical protein